MPDTAANIKNTRVQKYIKAFKQKAVQNNKKEDTLRRMCPPILDSVIPLIN